MTIVKVNARSFLPLRAFTMTKQWCAFTITNFFIKIKTYYRWKY